MLQNAINFILKPKDNWCVRRKQKQVARGSSIWIWNGLKQLSKTMTMSFTNWLVNLTKSGSTMKLSWAQVTATNKRCMHFRIMLICLLCRTTIYRKSSTSLWGQMILSGVVLIGRVASIISSLKMPSTRGNHLNKSIVLDPYLPKNLALLSAKQPTWSNPRCHPILWLKPISTKIVLRLSTLM